MFCRRVVLDAASPRTHLVEEAIAYNTADLRGRRNRNRPRKTATKDRLYLASPELSRPMRCAPQPMEQISSAHARSTEVYHHQTKSASSSPTMAFRLLRLTWHVWLALPLHAECGFQTTATVCLLLPPPPPLVLLPESRRHRPPHHRFPPPPPLHLLHPQPSFLPKKKEHTCLLWASRERGTTPSATAC